MSLEIHRLHKCSSRHKYTVQFNLCHCTGVCGGSLTAHRVIPKLWKSIGRNGSQARAISTRISHLCAVHSADITHRHNEDSSWSIGNNAFFKVAFKIIEILDGRIWPQWKEIHPLANVKLINAFHKARDCETILSKISFTAFFRRERQLWPSPVTTNVPEKFFSFRGTEAKIHSICLTLQTSSVTGWHCQLLATTDLREVTGRWLCSSLLILSVGHRSISYSLHAGNGARNILSIGPTPLAAHQSSKAGIQLCSFFWRKTFLVWQSEMESEWGHLIFCSTPFLPDQCDWTAWQHVPSVSLRAFLKGGKTEAALNQLQCFECWHLYSQHDWYFNHKLCFLSKKDYKQKIWPKSLLVWLYWLFLKMTENQACCLLHFNWNRCPASNFPSIYSNVSPMVWWKIHLQCAQILCTLQGCCSSAKPMQRLCQGGQSQACWQKPENVSWLQMSAMFQRWWLLLLKRRWPLGWMCPGSHQLRPHSWNFSTK